MIQFNFLPYREYADNKRKLNFKTNLFVSVLVGAFFACIVFIFIQSEIILQDQNNTMLNTELTVLNEEIKEIINLENEITILKARQDSVQDLQSDRSNPVNMFNELVKQIPEGIYLKSLRQEGRNISLQGVAQSNDRISELLHNLGSKSKLFTHPELIEIAGGTMTLKGNDTRQIANFSIKVNLVKDNDEH